MSKPQEPTQFTRESAERIARVVRAAELAVPQARPLAFDLAELPAKKVFRVCTFTGTWSINSEKTLTFYNITSTPNTVSAFNIFADIAGGTSSACLTSCGIAKSGTAWYLIAAGCQCG